jgi:magnesium chelatase family protein
MSFTGLPDPSVTESRDRLRAALHNSGAKWPERKITVALLPADVRKVGSRFDLAAGVALLAASEQVPAAAVAGAVWIAELGLDGRLRPVRGVLPSVLAAARHGVRRVVVARANAAEAALVSGVDVRAADRLGDIVEWLRGNLSLPPVDAEHPPGCDTDEFSGSADRSATAEFSAAEEPPPDLGEVAGQHAAKRALEIAAAGGHHLYLVGAPGAGKTMLAERLPGLLPRLDDNAALEVTAVHSLAGLLTARARLVRRAPLQAPHHTASVAALVGGGSYLARPGAISLAHHGVLFLDEAPEFSPRALDALRQPLETGQVVLSRGGGTVIYPARFQLVLAANPCGCARPGVECSCAPQARRRHQMRLSGPLMDRVDLRVPVQPVAHADLFEAHTDREDSATVAARVADARQAAGARLAGSGWRANAQVPGSLLRSPTFLPPATALRPAYEFLERGLLSARGFDRVLRVSWTIADLAGQERPGPDEVAEALYYRIGGGEAWAA